jgi:mannitol-1-phosphate/altronate dehydrogenase
VEVEVTTGHHQGFEVESEVFAEWVVQKIGLEKEDLKRIVGSNC